MARKGQRFQIYSVELMLEAMKLKEDGYTHAQIAEKLGITNKDTVKCWYRQFRKEGQSAFIDKQGRREVYKDKNRYVRKLEMENKILKKYLEILNKEHSCNEEI
ncbi:helix-turn-helix domain-containing protein [Aeribacillus composti]|uniref:helix-turn-helix domain-containing protein n=1 Tax=Aeribacillus composti TaxID=1868734 RepID=UPI002E244C9E|nr:helix-turn-helix domain-containing protein [Aeribacillus composti]